MTIFEEILSLLSGSPELHAYLLARPEQLRTTDYADIIAGAPVALKEKKRLLDRLSGHEAHSEDTGLIRDYSACLNTALQALESKEAVFSLRPSFFVRNIENTEAASVELITDPVSILSHSGNLRIK